MAGVSEHRLRRLRAAIRRRSGHGDEHNLNRGHHRPSIHIPSHEPYWQNVTVPAEGNLILSLTGIYNSSSFETCTPDATPSQIDLSQGYDYVYLADTYQVLTSGGIDGDTCLGANEGHQWVRVDQPLTPQSLPPAGNPAASGLPACHTADPIDCATGTYSQQLSLISIPGLGAPLQFMLNCDCGAAAVDSAVGFGWTANDFAGLSVNHGAATVVEPGGAEVIFELIAGR